MCTYIQMILNFCMAVGRVLLRFFITSSKMGLTLRQVLDTVENNELKQLEWYFLFDGPKTMSFGVVVD